MRRREFRLARTATMIGIWLSIILVGAANRDDVAQAQRLESVSVTIVSDGAQRQVRTAQTTVGATLKEAGVEVGPLDLVSPAKDRRISVGMRITIVRVNENNEIVSEPIAFETVKTFTKSLRPGLVKESKHGEQGEKRVHYRVRYVDGKTVARTPVAAEVVKKPVNRVVSIGSRGRYTSRGEFRTGRVLRMTATGYDPSPRSCGRGATGRTSCGMRAGYGVVAVDPRVIMYGSRLYVEGYGYAIAGDCGSSIKGNRIDLGFNTYGEARRFGRRSVLVHVLQQ